MIYPPFHRFTTLVLGLFLTFTTGCASVPSRFYTLNPLEKPEPLPGDSSQLTCIIVAVGPVIIPDYMDKPQIVTQSGQNEVVVNEFDRWSSSLENDISRVLNENLSSLLPIDLFRVVHWAPSIQPHLQIAYRVIVDVIRIELSPTGPVSLVIQWTLVNTEAKSMVMVQEATISEPAGGSGFAGMAAALSRALATLSRDIAGKIEALHTSEYINQEACRKNPYI